MAYEFKTLGTVEALTEVPENAHALVEVDGAIKRVPGGALGGSASGSGDWDAVLLDENGYAFNGIHNAVGSYGNVFQFIKGSAQELYEKCISGQAPKICFCSLGYSSHFDKPTAHYFPMHIMTSHGSGGRYIICIFYVYDYNSGGIAVSSVQIDVEDNSTHISFCATVGANGGEPQ